jgi:RimJ/RimL family protein N-acetyltransferase
MLHWEQILKDGSVVVRAIVFKGKVAGHILSWKQAYDQNIGYWLGREYWGRGIASAALVEFLKLVKTRPLYAHVAEHNTASRRVLEKCGFVVFNESKREIILKLSG